MSYAIKDGDKWYWMNPPDAKDGDQCWNTPNKCWWSCEKSHTGRCRGTQRRRLILPGTNAAGQEMEICGVDEVPPVTKPDLVDCFFNGQWRQIAVDAGRLHCFGKTVKEIVQAVYVAYGHDIIAIRRPKKQEQWPRYWLSKSDTLWRQDSETDTGSCLNKEGVFEKYIPKMQQLIECVKLLGLKPITPAEAQAIMEQNQPEGEQYQYSCPKCGAKFLDGVSRHHVCKPESQPPQGEGEQFPWTRETINIINNLTTEIKGKAADPDWFLLRNRFENMEARLKQSESQHQPPKPVSVKERLPEAGKDMWVFRPDDTDGNAIQLIQSFCTDKRNCTSIEDWFRNRPDVTHWLCCEPPYAIPPAPIVDDGGFEAWKDDFHSRKGYWPDGSEMAYQDYHQWQAQGRGK
jgi:hypothetical protein